MTRYAKYGLRGYDLEDVAHIIRNIPNHKVRATMREACIAYFQKIYPRFDAEKFREACKPV